MARGNAVDIGMRQSNSDFATASLVESTVDVFDPNDPKYRCCCNQCHAITGVRIIAGMLCVTVAFELWRFIITLCSLRDGGTGSAVLGSLFQLLTGIAIAASVIQALFKEKAAYLLPYLVLQAVGLAACAVFFVSFLYISLFDDGNTILTFIKSYGHQMSKNGLQGGKQANGYVGGVGWLMVVAFAVVLALQIWLIRIVFACWRFYRDKRAFRFLSGCSSYFVIKAPFSLKLRDSAPRRIVASSSADAIKRTKTITHMNDIIERAISMPLEKIHR